MSLNNFQRWKSLSLGPRRVTRKPNQDSKSLSHQKYFLFVFFSFLICVPSSWVRLVIVSLPIEQVPSFVLWGPHPTTAYLLYSRNRGDPMSIILNSVRNQVRVARYASKFIRTYLKNLQMKCIQILIQIKRFQSDIRPPLLCKQRRNECQRKGITDSDLILYFVQVGCDIITNFT